MINEVLQQTRRSSLTVKGLAAFDPYIMLKKPVDVALRHFEILFSTFSLRFRVSDANEPLCRDKYVQLLDHLRAGIGPNCDITSTSSDLIDFLVGLDFLQDKNHLLYLSKLCCLCATTPSPTYPDISLGNLTTGGRQN